jgi:hypothetical protein
MAPQQGAALILPALGDGALDAEPVGEAVPDLELKRACWPEPLADFNEQIAEALTDRQRRREVAVDDVRLGGAAGSRRAAARRSKAHRKPSPSRLALGACDAVGASAGRSPSVSVSMVTNWNSSSAWSCRSLPCTRRRRNSSPGGYGSSRRMIVVHAGVTDKIDSAEVQRSPARGRSAATADVCIARSARPLASARGSLQVEGRARRRGCGTLTGSPA